MDPIAFAKRDSAARPAPTSLLALLPDLWQRVLFPGANPAIESIRPLALLVLLLLPALLLYGNLSFGLFEPDEGRYAEIPREMTARGDWMVPYLEGEPYLDKPPLLYWLTMLSYRCFGTADWAARLVPALALHATILLTYLLGRRQLGERAAFYGACLLALAPGFISMGRLLILDGLLTLCVTVSLFAGYEAVCRLQFRWHWGLVAALACGLGILTKGPVAILLLVPPIWLFRRLNPTCSIRWRTVVALACLTTAIALPWYAAICYRLPRFGTYFLWQHNVVRFLAPFDHLRPIWFYLPVLAVGLLPGTLLFWPLGRMLLRADGESSRGRCPALGFHLLAGGWCVLFFSLAGCKLPTYVMPAFPFLCLALGYSLARGSETARRMAPRLGLLAFAVLALGHNLLLPWYATHRTPANRIGELRALCGSESLPIVTFPRNCDSVAFYLSRDDLRNFRSKETNHLILALRGQPRTVVLFSHRHALAALRFALPKDLQVVEEKHFGLGAIPGIPEPLLAPLNAMMGETSLGLCDAAIIERRPVESESPKAVVLHQAIP